jgi:PEP-CTERM motif-containing protein
MEGAANARHTASVALADRLLSAGRFAIAGASTGDGSPTTIRRAVMMKHARLGLLLALALAASEAKAAAVPISAVSGDTFRLDVSANTDVTDFDLQVLFPAALSATSVSLGPTIDPSNVLIAFLTDGTTQFDLPHAGLASPFDVNASFFESPFSAGCPLSPTCGTPFVLFSILFAVTGTVDGSVDIGPSAFLTNPSDPSLFNGGAGVNLGAVSASLTQVQSTPTSTPVPEPATVVLVGLGLAAMVAGRRSIATDIRKKDMKIF